MKAIYMLPLLLVTATGYGQTGLFHQVPFGAVAPVKTYLTDAGIGKGLKLAFGTLFFPEDVKKEWPVYGYSISNIRDRVCANQSVYGKPFTVGKAALVRSRQDLSEAATAYLGVPIRPTDGGSITARMEEVCNGIQQPDLTRKLDIYGVNDLPRGIWRKIGDPPPEEAVPLLSGTLTSSVVSERDYSMVWKAFGNRNPDVPEVTVAWRGYDYNPMLAEYRQSLDTVWRFETDSGVPHDYYLAKIGSNSQGDEGSQGDEDENPLWSSWTGRVLVEDVSDFTSGGSSSYSVWYVPEESQQSLDAWYFVTDVPLPQAEVDIRLVPFE